MSRPVSLEEEIKNGEFVLAMTKVRSLAVDGSMQCLPQHEKLRVVRDERQIETMGELITVSQSSPCETALPVEFGFEF
jgi:hypothetical protein